jgi:hypothetical protein
MTWVKARSISKAGDGRTPQAGDTVSLHLRLWKSRQEAAAEAPAFLDTYRPDAPFEIEIGSAAVRPEFEALLLDIPVGTTFCVEIPLHERLGALGLGADAFVEVHLASVTRRDKGECEQSLVEGHFGPLDCLDDRASVLQLTDELDRFGTMNTLRSGALSAPSRAMLAEIMDFLGIEKGNIGAGSDIDLIKMVAADWQRIRDLLSDGLIYMR